MPRLVANPPNPWLSAHREYLDEPPAADLEVYEEEAREVVSENDSPDLPFRFSVNPYRGCFHACAYCFARPTHQYLGFGAGSDFERRIVVKTNAPARLDAALRRPKMRGQTIIFSGVTDCYQPLEATYGLTRGCLETCLRHGNPVAIVTKGALAARDADLLATLARGPGAAVFVSVAFSDDHDARRLEPTVSPPSRRFALIRTLADAGVPVGVAVAPIIPGLNEHAIPDILRRATAAGAGRAFCTLLRLPAEVHPVFRERLAAAFPDRAAHVWAALRDMRAGAENDPRFGSRLRGQGPRWAAVHALFAMECRRLGLETGRPAERPARPPAPGPVAVAAGGTPTRPPNRIRRADRESGSGDGESGEQRLLFPG